LFVWDRASLSYLGRPWTCNPPALASWAAELQECTNVPSQTPCFDEKNCIITITFQGR
jgi:hypothetical protein